MRPFNVPGAMSSTRAAVAAGMFLVAAVVCLRPSPVAAQGPTTGSITGTVSDNTGAVLPGVTVTVAGPTLLGTQTTVTSAEGQYRFPSLPPGTFKLTFELPGFTTLIREGIILNVGFTAAVNVQLNLATVQETVTVSGQSPVVDTQNTTVQNTFTAEQLKNIPNARDLFGLIAEAPGMTVSRFDVGGSTAGTQTGYTSYGTSGQTRVQIDGVNLTEGTGGAGIYLDFGAYEEVQLGTSSNDAQMPVPGVLINTILKSGGNELHGDVYFDYENERLQSDNLDERLRNLGVAEALLLTKYRDPNANFGGPIKKDKLWYFGSVRSWVSATRTPGWPVEKPGSGPDFLTRLQNVTYKLTYQLNSNNKLTHFAQFARKNQPYRGASSTVSLDSVFEQENYYWVGKVELNRIVSPTFFFDARLGTFGYHWLNFAYGGDLERSKSLRNRMTDQFTGTTAGGYNAYSRDPRRYQAEVVGNLYRDNWVLGDHTLKFGYIWEGYSDRLKYTGFLDSVRLVFRSTNGVDFSMPFRVDLYNYPNKFIDQASHHGLFVQDQIRVGPRVTINAGLRWDYYDAFEPEQDVREAPFRDFFYAGVPLTTSAGPFSLQRTPFADTWKVPASGKLIQYKKAFAPRLGVAWDLRGDGRSVIKANWGRYYSSPSVELTQDMNPLNTTTATFGWIDRNSNRLFTLDELGPFVSLSGGAQNAVQPGIDHPYMDDMSLWFERQVVTDVGARVGFVYRKQNDQWQLIDVGRPTSLWSVPFTATDPGVDGRIGTADDGKFTAYNMSTVTVSRFERQAPEDYDQDFKNVELTLNKRMSNRWSLMASYLFTWRNTLWFGSPQNPNQELNNDAHSTIWTFKVIGTYQAPYGILISPLLRHQSGDNLPRQVSVATNGGTFSMLVEPADAYREDNVWIFDLRVEKQVQFWRNRRLGLFVDWFNINNTNAAQTLDSITGLRTVTVEGVQRQVARFLYPTTILAPRIARFGVKFTF